MDYIFYLARLLLGGYFILNGFGHFKNINAMSGYAASKKVLFPKASVSATGLLLFLGGLGVLSWTMVPIAVGMLSLFLILVSFKMHAFWNATDPNLRMNEYINFTKNMALLGGVLMLLFVGTVWVY